MSVGSSRGFFRPNIERRGRVVRGVLGALLLSAAAVLARGYPWLAGVVAASGLFVAFEATRGWCAVRACGIRTPM
jgi:hypothetical protein